jgi:hypothetical protein
VNHAPPTPTPVLTDAMRAQGACIGEDPHLFDPREPRDPDANYRYSAALRICRGCPIRDACRDEAASWGDAWGIFGGLMFADGKTAWQPAMAEKPPASVQPGPGPRIASAASRDRLDRDARVWQMDQQGVPREVIAGLVGVTERSVVRALRRVREERARATRAKVA